MGKTVNDYMENSSNLTEHCLDLAKISNNYSKWLEDQKEAFK